MGKAARKRQRGQGRYLARIANEQPDMFAEKWDLRVQSWLNEIRLSVAEWRRGGDAAREKVFKIVDDAMETLAICGPDAYERHAKRTYDVLCNECCAGAAAILDYRLYRLNNYKHFNIESAQDNSANRNIPSDRAAEYCHGKGSEA